MQINDIYFTEKDEEMLRTLPHLHLVVFLEGVVMFDANGKPRTLTDDEKAVVYWHIVDPNVLKASKVPPWTPILEAALREDQEIHTN